MADMLDGFRNIYEDFYGMTDEKERKKAINDRIRAAEEKSRPSSAARSSLITWTCGHSPGSGDRGRDPGRN